MFRNEPVQQVKPGSRIYYAQNYPNKAGSIISIQLTNDDGETFNNEIDFLIITTKPRYFETGEEGKLIEVSVRFLGANKVISVRCVTKTELARTEGEEKTITEVRFSFNIIDISLLCLRKKEPRQELANIYFANSVGLLQIVNGTSITYAGYVDNFQIDNNSNLKSSFPVVVRNSEDHIRRHAEKKRFLQWSIGLENPSVSNHLYFSNLIISLGNLEAFVEEEYMDLLLDYITSIGNRVARDSAQSDFDFVKRKYFDMIAIPDNFDFNKRVWEYTTIDRKNNYVYIDNLNLPTVKCLLSYFQDPSSTVDKDFALVSLVGVAVGGFESAGIDLKGLHRE